MYTRVVEVWRFGDGSHRKRLVMIAILRGRQDVFNAAGFVWPSGSYDEANAITAEDLAVADDQVPKRYWRTHATQQITKRYYEKPRAGEMHKVCRLGADMGSSYNPDLVLSHRGQRADPQN